jgi:hypothetical protein
MLCHRPKGYPGRQFVIFLSSSGQTLGQYLKIGQGRLLQHPFQFIFTITHSMQLEKRRQISQDPSYYIHHIRQADRECLKYISRYPPYLNAVLKWFLYM